MKQLLNLFILCFVSLDSFAQTEPRLVLPIGHAGEISTASFSPDNKYVVTSANDNTTRIWETFTGREVWLAHSRLTAFSPDGRFIVVGSSDSLVSLDKALYILDAKTGLESRPIIGLSDRIRSVVFSADSKKLLTITLDNIIEIWEAESGQRIQKISIKDSLVQSACFSPDGKRIIAELSNWSAVIIDVESGLEIHCLKGHKSSLSSFGFSPDGSKVLTTAIMDNIALLWDAASGKILHRLSGHSEWINSAIFSTDEKLALTAGYDGTVRIYDIATGNQLKVLTGHIGPVNTAVFSNDCEHVLTAGTDNTARVFDVVTGRELQVLRGHFGKVNSVVFSADDKYALTASDDQTARFWNLENGMEMRVFQGCSLEINSAVFSSDSKNILCAVNDSTARLFDLHSGNEVQVFRGHLNQVNSAVLSPNGKLALSASNDNTARIFDVSSGKELQILKGHKYSVNSAVFGPDGTSALTASWDGTARLWNTSTGKEIRSYEGHTGSVSSVFMSRDSITVFTTSADNTVRLWDVSSGSERQVHSFNEDNSLEVEALKKDLKEMGIKPREIIKGKLNKSILSQLISLVISPDGRFVLTSSRTGNTSIYELTSGQELCVLSMKNGIVYSAAFSPDCKQVVTANYDNTSRIWDVSSGKELQVLSGHTSPINSAVFSPDGKHILTTSLDHKTILWDAATGKALYTRLQLKENDWLVYDEHYRFDGTPGAIEKLYFVCGLEVVELNQFRKLLYVPHLVERILNGENLDHIAKLSQLQVCDHIPLVTPVDDNGKKYRFEITPRLSGVGDIEIYINGIKRGETIGANDLQLVNGKYYIEVDSLLIQEFTSPGEPAKIEVIAKTTNNDIHSRPAQMNTRSVQVSIAGQKENKLRKPELYAVLIGVDDYQDDDLDLKYASKDANDFHRSFQLAAEKYFNTDDTNRVHIYNLTIDRNGKTGSEKHNGMTPDKGTILRQLDEIEKKSKPADVILFFFAGHGKILSNNELLLLSTESQAIEPTGVRIDELFERFSKIKASKRILILDACHAGAAINQLNQFGLIGMRADDDVATRSMHEKELDKLASKEGFSILTACSSSQEAQELPQYEHGLMTFALLNSMLNNPKSLTETGELNLGQWFSQVDEEIKRLNIPDQDVQVSLPVVFNIGKVDEEVRTTIQLKELPTLFIESVMNMKMMRDNLELKKRLNTCLQNTLRGEHTGVLVADSPQATRVNIGYEEQGENVKVNALVYKGAIERSFEFNGSKAALDRLANEIIERVLQELLKE